MGYLEDLQLQINNRDFSKFWSLWEEYCLSDEVDFEEFSGILKCIKASDFSKTFGQHVETALPVWKMIQNPDHSYEIFKTLIDLQTTNSPLLADMALELLKVKYGAQPQFNERLRIIGLRTRDNFQGAISNYDLLNHLELGNFVFHAGGWGTGEVMEVSPLREQVSIEFENIGGKKFFTFTNAFKSLIPLANDSFLARRFGDPEALEAEAKQDPVKVIKQLLKDLGPKTAAEIKDEMCELVIPEKEWAKWWQAARAKIKKDTMIDTPESLKEPFRLHKAAVTHEERFHKAMGKQSSIDDLIQTTYSFLRDNPSVVKKADVKESIVSKLEAALKDSSVTSAQELQIRLMKETFLDAAEEGQQAKKIIQKEQAFQELLEGIDIIAFKKRVLTLVRENRQDWDSIFSSLLFTHQQSLVREYILKELVSSPAKKALLEKLSELARHPIKAPEFLVWYFQKLLDKGHEELPFGDKEGQCLFFEGFLILFSNLDAKPDYKDLSKKIYNMITGKRYAIVRAVLDGSSLDFVNEFLLLITKCHSLSDQDLKILRALAEVVHPSLNPSKQQEENHQFSGDTLWATEAAYMRTKDRMEQINSVEMVQTAKEIEAARALGDLRENSEYKFAQEKRHRLQGELKHLSSQLSRARIITKDDIQTDKVGIGSVVEITGPDNKKTIYTILGPFDADPDKGILSAHSRFAQAMAGKKKGETFTFNDEEFTIRSLGSYLDA